MFLISASRGLVLAMAEVFLKKDWNVVGTVRDGSTRTKLHDLADHHPSRLEIETVDITQQAQVEALQARLSGRVFQKLFVNAGTTNDTTQTNGEEPTDEIV